MDMYISYKRVIKNLQRKRHALVQEEAVFTDIFL